MYIAITLFYVAILGIFTMILLKRKEIKTGKINVLSRLGGNVDHVSGVIVTSISRGISYMNRHTLVAFVNWIAFHVLLRIRNIYVELKHQFISNPHGKKLIDAVRGRGEVRDHGASFYLRRISEK